MSVMTIELDSAGFYSCEICPETWCAHVANFLREGRDADSIHPGAKIIVPIVPTETIFAEVHIDSETIGESALMTMHYTPDVGRMFKTPLGFWNPGEGRLVISGVILDQIYGSVHPDDRDNTPAIKTKCPNRAHNLKSSRIMAQNKSRSWKMACLWNIVMEKACTPCVEDASAEVGTNFGIDESITDRPAWRS